MSTSTSRPRRTIMVSSTVYGIEELLERVYSLLTGFGYEVWMSHAGTVQTFSDRPAFANCLDAVDQCDLFLGIITPQYGSGQDKKKPDEPSITHQEIRKAIDLKKPRWLLAHDHVVFARALLASLGYKGKAGRSSLKLKESPVFDDLRVLDLYEEAIRDGLPLEERDGNWVQKFSSTDDGSRFVVAQFFRYQEVERFLDENFKPATESKPPGGQP